VPEAPLGSGVPEDSIFGSFLVLVQTRERLADA
jgi:hypothetical protein